MEDEFAGYLVDDEYWQIMDALVTLVTMLKLVDNDADAIETFKTWLDDWGKKFISKDRIRVNYTKVAVLSKKRIIGYILIRFIFPYKRAVRKVAIIGIPTSIGKAIYFVSKPT
jgi:hypothetical protein